MNTNTPSTDDERVALISQLRDFKVKDQLTGGEAYFPYLLAEETADFIIARDTKMLEQADKAALQARIDESDRIYRMINSYAAQVRQGDYRSPEVLLFKAKTRLGKLKKRLHSIIKPTQEGNL